MAYVKIAEKISKTIKIQNNQKDKIKKLTVKLWAKIFFFTKNAQ
jgi:hypothetical protein